MIEQYSSIVLTYSALVIVHITLHISVTINCDIQHTTVVTNGSESATHNSCNMHILYLNKILSLG